MASSVVFLEGNFRVLAEKNPTFSVNIQTENTTTYLTLQCGGKSKGHENPLVTKIP